MMAGGKDPAATGARLVATLRQVSSESFGKLTARTDSLLVRTRCPSWSLIFGSDPRCLQFASNRFVPSAPAETITPCVVSDFRRPRTRPGEFDFKR